MYGIIYLITNKINGIQYVGQTIRTLEIRWKEHCSNRMDSIRLSRAINKYGEKSFSKEIVGIFDNEEDLNNAEEYFIEWYNSLSPNGYNLHTGGNNHKISEETRKRMSKSKMGEKHWTFGKSLTKKHRDNLSKSKKGKKKDAAFKLKRSIYMKEKAAKNPGIFFYDSVKNIFKEANDKRKIPIFCHQTNQIYESLGDAARKLKISKTNISSVLKGKYKQCNGYTFCYVEVRNEL